MPGASDAALRNALFPPDSDDDAAPSATSAASDQPTLPRLSKRSEAISDSIGAPTKVRKYNLVEKNLDHEVDALALKYWADISWYAQTRVRIGGFTMKSWLYKQYVDWKLGVRQERILGPEMDAIAQLYEEKREHDAAFGISEPP